MSYAVLLPGPVESRIFDYAAYIALDNPAHAMAWMDSVYARVHSLADMPRRHPISEIDSSRLGVEVRMLVHGDYVICYQVDEANRQVLVMDIVHGAQRRGDPPAE